MSAVRTRFAPSPTGSLHLGNARIAALSWLIARHHGGAFVLRIEDTDLERNVPGAEAEMLEDLRWLGLEWDEGPDPAGGPDLGPEAPYRQSERLEVYRSRAEALLERGAAYRCFCSPETLEAEREQARAEGRAPGYGGRCRALDAPDAAGRAAAGAPYVVRLATPERGEVVVEDAVRGRVVFDAAEISDFVLVRSDGLPTYNFAVVVDDAAMNITHVIRGVGHLSNTPHQVLVYGALGLEPPVFAHAPTVLGTDRKKLSKRHGAPSLRMLREEGLHPDGVLNYLSLLGWSSESGEEILSRTRLVEEVGLERLGAADVVFDPDKLRWFSARHIEAMPLPALVYAVRPELEAAGLPEDTWPVVVAAVRSHLSAFSEIREHLDPFTGALDAEGEARRERLAEDPRAREVAAAAHRRLEALDDWDEAAIADAVRAAGSDAGAKGRELYLPLRVALTGQEHGPPLAAVAAVQGRERVLQSLSAVVQDRQQRQV